MNQHRDLSQRIGTLRAIREVVNAMKTHASLQWHQCEGRLEHLREYRHLIHDELAFFLADPRPLEGPRLLVVFGSERGLCGGFHGRLVDAVLEGCQQEETRLLVVGNRTARFLTERGIEPEVLATAPRTLQEATAALHRLAATMERLPFGRLDLAFAQVERLGRFQITIRELLPPKTNTPRSRRPFHYASEETMRSHLISEYLFLSLTSALTESLAAENSARLLAMETASSNLDAAISKLTSTFQRAKQEEITTGVIELLAGAMALRRR